MTKALIACSMVVDIEPDEIPEFAARLEKVALAGIQAAFDDAPRPLDEDEAVEFQERFQFYGVSYLVQQVVEPPKEEP